MKNVMFKVRYDLHSLKIKNNPLFSNVRAYLLVDDRKQLIGASRELIDNQMIFRTTFEEREREMIWD